MGERGPQKHGREMGCTDSEYPSYYLTGALGRACTVDAWVSGDEAVADVQLALVEQVSEHPMPTAAVQICSQFPYPLPAIPVRDQ